MDFGDNMILIRKKKGPSQAALGKTIGTSGDVIGRYDRSDIKPSIEVIIKIADELQVSIDYLVGKTNLELDTTTVKRIEDIANLPAEEKKHVFKVLDALLRDYKTQQAYGK